MCAPETNQEKDEEEERKGSRSENVSCLSPHINGVGPPDDLKKATPINSLKMTATVQQGFNCRNWTTLIVLTFAFIIGELSHFLVGTVSRDMARDIHFGTMKCYDAEGLDEANANMECKEIESEQE